MNARIRNTLIKLGVVGLLAVVVGYFGIWTWSFCRVEVPPGKAARLRYKGPWPFGNVEKTPEGTLVQLDDRGRPTRAGVIGAMVGPGRHFYSPLEYEVTIVDDVLIRPGQLGVVTSKVGKSLPPGRFLADTDDERGIRRKVLTPGRYRINDYAFDVEIVPVNRCVETAGGVQFKDGDALLIPAGYVGVVTNKASNPATGEVQGTQDEVLQPGIYYLNPFEKRVDILSVGYNETTLSVETKRNPDGTIAYAPPPAPLPGAPPVEEALSRDPIYVPGKGIEFPSKDGFPIHIDFTAIWGILPDQAPDVIRQFGSQKGPGGDANALKVVEQNVILPQIESLSRLNGSRQGAVDLLIGDSREEFQTDLSEELERVLADKNLTLLFGLTRHLYVPAAVREQIQRSKIANEVTITLEQQQLTEQAKGALNAASAMVVLAERTTKAATGRKVAELGAEGEKKAGQLAAEAEQLAAEIDAQTALIDAQITTTMGRAEAMKTELANRAQADRYALYVKALGSPDAYNRYMFAESLPADLRLGIFYAGPGTFWTDLKGFEQILLGKLASESEPAAAPKRPAVAPTAAR